MGIGELVPRDWLLDTGLGIGGWLFLLSATCVSCQHSDENHGHLFFYCSFSRVVWADLLRRNLILRCPGDWDFETGDWDFDIGWASLHYKG